MINLICILRIRTYNLILKLTSFFYFFHRTSIEYPKGAMNFVHVAKRNVRSVEKNLCPCKDCRNLSRHDDQIIVEHLVIKGMDPKYIDGVWFNHGEEINVENKTNTFDVYELFKMIHYEDEDFLNQDFFLMMIKMMLILEEKRMS